MNIISHYANEACESALSYISENPSSICQDPRIHWGALFSIATVMTWGAYTLYNRYAVQDMNNATLFEHAKLGNLNGIARAIKSQEDLNQQDYTGNTALNWACQKGHYTIVKKLIGAGVDLSLVNSQKRNPLHSACDGQHLPIVELLLQAGKENKKLGINKKDNQGETPLMIASRRGYAQIAKALLNTRKKLQLDISNTQGQTALHLAARESAPIVKALLEKKANPNCLDSKGQLPIHHAANQDNSETLALLLPGTTNPNHQDVDGKTALHNTCQYQQDRLEAAGVLLEDRRVDPNVLNDEGVSPLHEACLGMSGDWNLAKRMLASGRCDLTLQEKRKEGNTPVHLAAHARAYELLAIMLKENGVNLMIENGNKEPVIEAILSNRDERCLTLVFDRLGGDENKNVTISGLTPIEWATVTQNRFLEEKLNSRGIYFKYSENRKLIEATLKHAIAPLRKFLTLRPPIKFKELREFFEDLENLETNAMTPLKQPYLMGLAQNGAEAFLKNCALRAVHNQQGTRVPLMDLTFDSPWFSWKSLLELVPPSLKNQFEAEMNQDVPFPLLMNLPQPIQWLLQGEVSFLNVEKLRILAQEIMKMQPRMLQNPFQMFMPHPPMRGWEIGDE